MTYAKASRKQSLEDFENDEVKVFLSPNWTLEYEISISLFQTEFYRALLWAEKLSNSQSGIPQESKAGEVDAKVNADLGKWRECWSNNTRKNEKIAFEIYQNMMLGKEISKAVTAQVFAAHLEERLSGQDACVLKSEIQAAKSLKYILNAIYHVTEPKEVAREN